MENSKPSKPYFSILITSLQENRKPLFRMWLFMTTVSLISMLLGIGIFIITLGVLFPVKKILVYWPPANAWLSKTFGLKTPKPNKPDSLIN